jgi:hypothetical protein
MQSFIFVMLWLKIFSSGETVQPLLSFSPKHKIRNKCYNFEWENWKRKMYNAAIPGVVITTIPIVVGVNGLNLVYCGTNNFHSQAVKKAISNSNARKADRPS